MFLGRLERADLLASCENQMPGRLTAGGQTKVSVMPIAISKRPEIQRSAGHHCLHSGMHVPHCAGSSYFLVVYEWHCACVQMT